METRASYVVVGTFVLALFAAAFGVVIFLTRANLEDAPRPYMSYFSGSVTGLQIGSAVRYRGVPVGTVTDIRIDPATVVGMGSAVWSGEWHGRRKRRGAGDGEENIEHRVHSKKSSGAQRVCLSAPIPRF